MPAVPESNSPRPSSLHGASVTTSKQPPGSSSSSNSSNSSQGDGAAGGPGAFRNSRRRRRHHHHILMRLGQGSSSTDTDCDGDDGGNADAKSTRVPGSRRRAAYASTLAVSTTYRVLAVVVAVYAFAHVAATLSGRWSWGIGTGGATGFPHVPHHSADDAFITDEALEYGLAVCSVNALKAKTNPASYRTGGPPPQPKTRRNPRYEFLLSTPLAKAAGTKNGHPILIRNATVWDGVGNIAAGTDVLLAHGLIAKIGRGLTRQEVETAIRDSAAGRPLTFSPDNDIEEIDAGGRVVSPGLVDQHSHVGVFPLPMLASSLESNEMSTTMLAPQLRAVDAVNVLDPSFDLVLSGGVTTSMILPGSALLMGGEALGAKMLRPRTNEPAHLDVNLGMDAGVAAADGKRWRWLKMACGENPKGVASKLGLMPSSRMGTGWLFRRHFEAARALLRAQDDWCVSAASARRAHGADAHRYVAARYPEDLAFESLVALLRGDVRLQVHCYDPQDIEMMIRNKHEFGFEIGTFHHATEAYLIAPLLARENVSAAIFADFSLYKHEMYEHSVRAGQLLHEAGARFAYKSDHPALNAQNLAFEAQKAAHYGLDPQLAFAAVTSAPADSLGLGWRIGRIAESYDADVVIWDRPPLELGAHPVRVIVDGFTGFSRAFGPERHEGFVRAPPVKPPAQQPEEGGGIGGVGQSTIYATYSVVNASAIYAGPGVVAAGAVVVRDGIVACVGGDCEPDGAVFDLNGGVVMPGMVVANTNIGLSDIEFEEGTKDGTVDPQGALAGLAHAADGLRVGGGLKQLQYAFRHGVLTAVSTPEHSGMVAGFSVAFRTGAELYDDAIIKRDAALHVSIGSRAKDPYAKSISMQIARLRELLAEAADTASGSSLGGRSNSDTSGCARCTGAGIFSIHVSAFARVVSGELPLIVEVHDPSDIAKVLEVVSAHAGVRLVLAGATGAWKLAQRVAAAGARVLLQPARCLPGTWETRACVPPFATGETAAEALLRAGVVGGVGVAPGPGPATVSGEPDRARGLRFEAGWLAAEAADVGLDAAIGAATWAVAEAFGLAELGIGRVAVGTRANLIGLDAAASALGPLSLAATVQLLGDGETVTLQPRQD